MQATSLQNGCTTNPLTFPNLDISMEGTGIFVPKCGCNGRWVCTHSDETHISSRSDRHNSNKSCHDDFSSQQQRYWHHDDYVSDDSAPQYY